MSKDPSHHFDDSGGEMTQEVLKLVRSIDERLTKLEAKVDERLFDTRPIWERALAEIGEVRTAQEQTNARLDQLRDEMKMGFHKLERQLMRLSKDFLEIRTEMDMLEDRIEKLEPQPST